MNQKEQSIYVETKRTIFGEKQYYRYLTPGTEEMLLPKHGENILVKLRNVDITYGSGSKAFKAVSDFCLNIYQGEVLGLVGESGSGKSTIGKTLVGLVPYSFGEIQLLDKTLPKKLKRGFKFGKALKEYKAIENFMVNKVQMIFQDPANSLNPHINVEKVVSEGLDNTKNAKEIYLYNFDQEVEKELKKLLPEAQYPQFYGEFAKKLSADIAQNENVAYQALYERFLDELASIQNQAALEYLSKQKQERDKLNKLSEKECKRILVVDMLKSVGLDESVLKRYPLEFSGGQQQRIGISRSVVLRPQLLVADEPISALDVSIQAQVVNIFNELKEKYNLTILFIAHDLRMVEYISDRIAVMNKGRLLEVGKTEEIMKRSLHPYTKSLLDAVPSIHGTKGSLIGYVYNPAMHGYNEDKQPIWNKINDDHYVLGTPEEIKEWKQEFWK
ncbi:ABC transporter ATP-binding protein [Mycoplasmopsis gallopavonis]|uniref:Phosphate ABC transporter ATP-binding protein n=1 Tax=Mycoplasmopsis gallopavonis TaxID=76629 RepID=A0A449AZS4_9BACT|nr:ABC transporter ATP-binding protein [Mycoplasmopsis gallopavonis]RIV16667.1 ABC transporter ATP-binding protein [Mycoplasmopsis gallopavonis]VEU73001.1 phosphate ABC transporter ATP-binding protein [Mycoplasmopsis gallopavonis]VEU73307.1 phosphate ABC transporter ATP-binding protein [Mycoplasmopsis gallopavonis]